MSWEVQYEVIEAGYKTELLEEIIIKDNDNETEIIELIKSIFKSIDDGKIRFGSKKSRGLGKFKVDKVYKKEYSKDKERNWYDFNWDSNKMESFNSWKQAKSDDDYISVSLKLDLKGCISIRQYSANMEDYDFEHIANKDDKNNIKPLIPGSSWNGAFRHRAREILTELKMNKKNISTKSEIDKNDKDYIESRLNEAFGYVKEEKAQSVDEKEKTAQSVDKKEKTAQQSAIIFDESILKDSVEMVMTRNKINRFDASTINGALYTEKSYYGGNTDLVIHVNNKNGDKDWVIGLLILIIKDIEYGFLAIGGETSIGRGLFEKHKNENITISTSKSEDFYLKKLAKLI